MAVWKEVLRSRPDPAAAVHCSHDFFGTWLSFHLVNARFLLGNALASLERHDEARAIYREGMERAGKQLTNMLGPPAFIEALKGFEEARQTFIERLHSSAQDRNLWIRAGGTFLVGRPAR